MPAPSKGSSQFSQMLFSPISPQLLQLSATGFDEPHYHLTRLLVQVLMAPFVASLSVALPPSVVLQAPIMHHAYRETAIERLNWAPGCT